MGHAWPEGFDRIPAEAWVDEGVDPFARGYDAVGRHGWYTNLDPTVEAAASALPPGGLMVDYSAGTGLLEDRLLPKLGADAGVLLVDASAKFLRLAVEKFRADDRVAFRLLPWVPAERRLRRVGEVVGPVLGGRGADLIVSANAIHLYADLATTLESWHRILKPGGRVLIQSGNIGPPTPGRLLIDDTVHGLQAHAEARVRGEARFAAYRTALGDSAAMAAHAGLRRRFFPPVRPLGHYLDALAAAGFAVESVERRCVPVRVEEWAGFLAVYHEGVLGWVGGSEKVEGRPPTAQAVRDRQELVRLALFDLFPSGTFEAEWAYVAARRP